ncbi:hypothetical protein CQW23_13479 [Capsicum baccatum]|uniref:Cytochrome c oxidase polypeptide II n=1 Tax=Capsicum baccatum TaxID=33114 RepID=A0A2G2WVR2_CAPBA|nr:hypothetical protein CQW23_13479 [Capsicum baccatum]
MGHRMLRFDFVSWDPLQVGFESRVMGDYPARFEEHFYPANQSALYFFTTRTGKVEEIQSLFLGAELSKNEPNQMLVLECLFLTIAPCDAAEPCYIIPEDDLELGRSHLLEVDNRVVLPAKSHIHFTVTSADVPHSWDVPSLGVKYDFVPDRLNQTSILDRLGRRDFAKGGLSVCEEGIFPLSFHFLTRIALQGREGIRASIKRLRSSYGHKEIRNCTIDRVNRGPDLDVEKSSQPEAKKKAYHSVGVK